MVEGGEEEEGSVNAMHPVRKALNLMRQRMDCLVNSAVKYPMIWKPFGITYPSPLP
jgi:hypothetical protein